MMSIGMQTTERESWVEAAHHSEQFLHGPSMGLYLGEDI